MPDAVTDRCRTARAVARTTSAAVKPAGRAPDDHYVTFDHTRDLDFSSLFLIR